MTNKPETYRTKTGRILTDADIQALADEAEGGYDVEHLARRPGRPRMGSAVLDLIGDRDHQRCLRCSALGADRHHRKRRSQGGKNLGSNLILLCGSGTTGCHGWVHAHPEESYQRGWLVSGAQDPAAVPVYSLTWGSWVLLGDDLTVKLVGPPRDDDARNYPERETV